MSGTSTCSRPGYGSFLKHLKELESAVTDPGGLAVELYSNGLIDRVAKERASLMALAPIERSRELLQKLEDKIKSREALFEKFLSILVRDPTFEDICTKLRATRGNLLLLVWRAHKCIYAPSNPGVQYLCGYGTTLQTPHKVSFLTAFGCATVLRSHMQRIHIELLLIYSYCNKFCCCGCGISTNC